MLPIEFSCGLIAMVVAQIIKIPLNYIFYKKWNIGIAFSTGGMPSSHSAMTWALTTAVAFTQGINSTYFAIAITFSIITSYDAMGIRRQAGYHAEILNVLVEDFKNAFSDKTLPPNKKLKILLGHKPQEVFMGILFGIFTSTMVFLYVL